MIAFRRGVLADTIGTDVVAEIDGARLVAEVPVPLGPTPVGASLMVVQTTVEVGIERRELTVAIGPGLRTGPTRRDRWGSPSRQ
jgi:hypothetical protein